MINKLGVKDSQEMFSPSISGIPPEDLKGHGGMFDVRFKFVNNLKSEEPRGASF